jgi:hypothetical protein
VKIDYRWGAGDVELYRRYAAELLALMPDVILVSGTPVMEVLREPLHLSMIKGLRWQTPPRVAFGR